MSILVSFYIYAIFSFYQFDMKKLNTLASMISLHLKIHALTSGLIILYFEV